MSTSRQYVPKAAAQPKLYLNDKGLRDLASSGITPETAAVEKIFSAPSRLTHKILGWPAGRATLVFQYGLGFFRLKLERKQKEGKQYRQPRGTTNQFYVPRVLPDHDRVRADPTIPLIISEGEKKAIKGCQEGLTVVSLPGVYGFSFKKDDTNNPIPDLDRFAWEGRDATIVFDSDPSERSKGDVDRARRWLAALLTVRGANVWAVILPDDGKTKVGLDDYLLRHSVQEFLALPRVRVPLCSPLTNSNGGERRSYVSEAIETLIWNKILKKSSDGFSTIPDFEAPVRTLFNRGMQPEHLTSRVKSRNGRDPRIKVGKQTFAYVIAYFNLRRQVMHPKGCCKMVSPRGKDIPIWQGLMELEAGDLTLPDEYRVSQVSDSKESVRGPVEGTCLCGCGTVLGEKSGRKYVNDGHRKRANRRQIKEVSGVVESSNVDVRLPECAPQEARDVLGAWLKTLWVRRCKYPGCAGVFDPEMVSLMLGKPRTYVLSGWYWLEEYRYVEAVYEKDSAGNLRELFQLGKNPIDDPEAYDQRLRDLEAGEIIIQKSSDGSGKILEVKQITDDRGYEVFLRSPTTKWCIR
jgi:Domain of unknown function (DUF3854)